MAKRLQWFGQNQSALVIEMWADVNQGTCDLDTLADSDGSWEMLVFEDAVGSTDTIGSCDFSED